MKSSFIIPPYANFLVTDEVMFKIQNDKNDDPIAGKRLQNKEKVSIMHYANGERRFVFLLPVKAENGFIQGIFPDPVLLYLETAEKMLLSSQVVIQKGFPSSVIPTVDGETRLYDATSDTTSEVFNSILQYRICSIIMLHAAVEAFINELIPDDISYPTIDKGGNPVYLGKEKVFWLPFAEKLKKVIPFVKNVDLVRLHSDTVDKIDFISQIRNGFVHLKSESSEVLTKSYSTTFYEMLRLNLEMYFESVHEFINLLKPGYLKYHQDEPSESLFG